MHQARAESLSMPLLRGWNNEDKSANGIEKWPVMQKQNQKNEVS